MFEIEEKVQPILSELIKAVKVEGNLLHSLRITPADNSVVFYVASINVATKVHTGREKVIPFDKTDLPNLVSCCEEYIKPVGFNMEGDTYHWFFFPDIKDEV